MTFWIRITYSYLCINDRHLGIVSFRVFISIMILSYINYIHLCNNIRILACTLTIHTFICFTEKWIKQIQFFICWETFRSKININIYKTMTNRETLVQYNRRLIGRDTISDWVTEWHKKLNNVFNYHFSFFMYILHMGLSCLPRPLQQISSVHKYILI